jgi:hypothetical protein
MAECLQIFRARVPQASVAALLEIRPPAIAEAQRLCPELLGAQLVRLDDTTRLDVLTWSRPTVSSVCCSVPPSSAQSPRRTTCWAR